MKEVAIIDYGMCNIDSVARAVEKCGGDPFVTDSPDNLDDAVAIILPGVGSFSDAMQELREKNLISAIRKQVLKEDIPFLGICLGMQLMATTGYEGGETEGLDLIPGNVIRLEPEAPDTRIPHIGWNQIEIKDESPLFDNIQNNSDFYFVHSFHFACDDQYIISTTPYCGSFISGVAIRNCYGVQFHPEKSLKSGMQILTNFLSLC